MHHSVSSSLIQASEQRGNIMNMIARREAIVKLYEIIFYCLCGIRSDSLSSCLFFCFILFCFCYNSFSSKWPSVVWLFHSFYFWSSLRIYWSFQILWFSIINRCYAFLKDFCCPTSFPCWACGLWNNSFQYRIEITRIFYRDKTPSAIWPSLFPKLGVFVSP